MEYPYNPKNLLRIFIISLKYFINPPFYNDKALQSMGIFCFFVINAVREVAMHIHRDLIIANTNFLRGVTYHTVQRFNRIGGINRMSYG